MRKYSLDEVRDQFNLEVPAGALSHSHPVLVTPCAGSAANNSPLQLGANELAVVGGGSFSPNHNFKNPAPPAHASRNASLVMLGEKSRQSARRVPSRRTNAALHLLAAHTVKKLVVGLPDCAKARQMLPS